MNKLSKAEIKEFIKDDGKRCPVCGDIHIAVEDFEPEGNFRQARCLKSTCRAEWRELYQLVGAELR